MPSLQSLQVSVQTVGLLLLSNVFMIDDLWAALCMVGAVYFIFRSG
jgi:uncharacterized protein (DUF486 family)